MLFNWNVMIPIHSDCHDLGTHKVMLAASPPEILAESAVIGQLACQPWSCPSLAGSTPPWFSCRRIFSGHPALRRGKLSSFTKKSKRKTKKTGIGGTCKQYSAQFIRPTICGTHVLSMSSSP